MLIILEGEFQVLLKEVDVLELKLYEVIVCMEVFFINLLDMWFMFGLVSLDKVIFDIDKSVLVVLVYKFLLNCIKLCLDQILFIGNEGVGMVVKVGDSLEV